MHIETVNLREDSYPILIGEGGSLSLENYEDHITGKDIAIIILVEPGTAKLLNFKNRA